jgi:hypothetical protein
MVSSLQDLDIRVLLLNPRVFLLNRRESMSYLESKGLASAMLVCRGSWMKLGFFIVFPIYDFGELHDCHGIG